MAIKTNQSSAIKDEFNFSTLGIWIKLYLVALCAFSLILSIVMVSIAIKKGGVHPAALVAAVSGLCGYAYWHLWAVSRRKVKHITTLAVLNLIIGGNILGCLMMFFIRQSTVKEISSNK